MAGISRFEARRLENIQRNAATLEDLGINQQVKLIKESTPAEPAKKRRKVDKKTKSIAPPASRSSARIASAPASAYDEDALIEAETVLTRKPKAKRPQKTIALPKPPKSSAASTKLPPRDLQATISSWSSWTPTAAPPTRDANGTFHFPSHPIFTPNRSPEQILREGCFGGSYFRPLYSATLRTTIRDDYLELPSSWIANLDVATYLANDEYNPEINKYKVACGQSIEEWEKAGWINHDYDVRGWFQWYCRFFMGRRCDDDERQVSRWKKCVGDTGRWRRMLLKRYVMAGVREVADDGAEQDGQEVSPVMHQTCHHWAFCVTQEVLDEYWRSEN